MKLIVCLDDKKGMMFNHRRQSRDSALIDDLICHIADSKLYITEFSEKLFCDKTCQYEVVEAPCNVATKNDYCFIEDKKNILNKDDISEIVIYHWNRHYPADVWFDVDMSDFNLISVSEFAGSSHDKITKEVWKK